MCKIITKDPRELRMHPYRKLLPVPGQDRINAISDEIKAGTPMPAIYIVEPNLVVAGWTRTLAHRLQQKNIDCIVITEEQVSRVALGENPNRMAYPWSYQLVWAYMPLTLKVLEDSNKRRIANLKKGAVVPDSPVVDSRDNGPQTLEDVAGLIGVSRSLLFSIKGHYETILKWDAEHEPKRWKGAKEKQTALDYFTSKIFDPVEPCTPGNCVAGLAGNEAGEQGETKPTPKQLELFTEGLASVRKWGNHFTKFEGNDLRKAQAAIKATVAAWPKQLREEFAFEINRIKREEKQQGGTN